MNTSGLLSITTVITANPFLKVYVIIFVVEAVLLLDVPKRAYFVLRFLLCVLVGSLILVLFGMLPLARVFGIAGLLGYYVAWILAWILAGICFKLTITGSLFVSATSYTVQHMAFNLTSLPILNRIDLELGNYFDIVMAILLGLLIFFIMVRPYRDIFLSVDTKQILISVLLLVLCVGLSFMRGVEGVERLISAFYDLICCACCLIIQFSISNAKRTKESNEALLEAMSLQHDQHIMTGQAMDMINIKLHDLRHQISSLQKVMENSDSRRLDPFKRSLALYSSMPDTGNDVLDAVIMEKGLLCEMQDIYFSCVADGRQLAFMNPAEIFSLINNILDNAIESEIKEEDKERRIIDLRIARNNDMILIDAENYCRYPVEISGNKIQSTKKDTINHGFGMKSIEFIVNKYQGELLISQEDDMFRVSVVMPAIS